jgi:hypothetical protein
MPKSVRKLLFVASFFVLWGFLLSSSNANTAGATVCAVVADPSNFDRQAVALDGVVTSLRETTSQRGNDYTTFRLQGANGCGAVTIFTWGHPALTDAASVHVDGLFETEHHAGKYIFHIRGQAGTSITPVVTSFRCRCGRSSISCALTLPWPEPPRLQR